MCETSFNIVLRRILAEGSTSIDKDESNQTIT